MDLKKLINQTHTTIVDVRQPFEFAMGHVEGAINIPLGEIPFQLDDFREMSRPIILYCRSGNRSGQAVTILHAHGIREAYNGGSLDDVRELLTTRYAKAS